VCVCARVCVCVHATLNGIPCSVQTAQDVEKKLKKSNINVAFSGSIDNDPQHLLQNIKVHCQSCQHSQSCDGHVTTMSTGLTYVHLCQPPPTEGLLITHHCMMP